MSASILDVISAQLEQVRPILADYTDGSTNLFSFLKPSEQVETTRYLYRIPFLQYVAGVYRKYSADGASMGTGNGMKIGKLEAGFYDNLYAFELTKEQTDTTVKGVRAVIDILSETMDRAMKWISKYDDIWLHGDGTGKLTNASSASSSTTLTFASSTDFLGTNRLFDGMSVSVWDSTGATERSGGPYQIQSVDYNSKVVTFTGAVSGITTGDLLAVVGAAAYGPSTLTSFSSTWPGGGLTNGPGLTGDTFRHGLAYANDNDSSRYYLQNLKSTVPKLMPGYVNVNGFLTFMAIENLKSNIYQSRDESAIQGQMGVMHMCQLAQLKSIGISISYWMRSGGEQKNLDLLPSDAYGQTFDVGGIPCFVSKAADKSRVDFFKKDNWFKVESEPANFYQPGGGPIIRPKYDGSGDVTSSVEFKIVQKMDTGCVDPGAGGYLYNCSVIPGF